MITAELVGGPLDGARYTLEDEFVCPRFVVEVQALAPAYLPSLMSPVETEPVIRVLRYLRGPMAGADGVWRYRFVNTDADRDR